MPSPAAHARVRSTAALAVALAFAAGSTGPTALAAGPAEPAGPAPATPVPTTEPVPAPTPSPTPTPLLTPEPEPEPVAEVTASAVVLADPSTPLASPAELGPSLRFVSSGKHLRTARLRSLNVKTDVAGASRLRAWVILPKSAVKASAVDGERRDSTLARLSLAQPPSGRITLKFRFGGHAQEALLPFYKVTVLVRLVATDAKGHTTTVDQPIALSD